MHKIICAVHALLKYAKKVAKCEICGNDIRYYAICGIKLTCIFIRLLHCELADTVGVSFKV